MATATQKKAPAKSSANVSGRIDDLHGRFIQASTEIAVRIDKVEELAEENRDDMAGHLGRIELLEKFVGYPSAKADAGNTPKSQKDRCRCYEKGTANGDMFLYGLVTGVLLVGAILLHSASRYRNYCCIE